MAANQAFRILKIYEDLIDKGQIDKNELINEFKVNEKTIQRDIEFIRNYLSDNYESKEDLLYDRRNDKYYLSRSEEHKLSSVEIFSIIKILLESRAFCKEEMERIVNTVSSYASHKDKKIITNLVLNEKYHFQPLNHKKTILKNIWDLNQYILKKEAIQIELTRFDGQINKRIVYPLSIVFSEFYFYLVAKIEGSRYDSPAFFRIDKLDKIQMINKNYTVDKRFEDGEFKKRIMFMHGGDLMKIKFKYTGKFIEHIIDRFPILEVKNIDKDIYEFDVEVYGKGCLMWFLSQGENIEIISPQSLRQEIIDKINNMSKVYK
ncbi:Uncharacterised protein [uncultured Clostridium sp.]|nr:Uncharacterised protein [uncultured Clostridium sp.]SCJ44786.1 Uncharacterised protein [uncultured Clostridium sp.]